VQNMREMGMHVPGDAHDEPTDSGETRRGRNQPGRGGPFLGHSRPQFGSSRSRAIARGISSTIEGYLPMKAVAAVLPVLAVVAPAGFWSALARGRSMEKTVPFARIPECDRGTNT